MKQKIALPLFILLLMQTCCESDENRFLFDNISFKKEIIGVIDSLDNKLNPEIDIFLFVERKGAIKTNYHLLTKKAYKTDFDNIGSPLFFRKIRNRYMYVYSGMESICEPPISWNRHLLGLDSLENGIVHPAVMSFTVFSDSIFQNDTLQSFLLVPEPTRPSLRFSPPSQ